MQKTLSAAVIERIDALTGGVVKLRCEKAPLGRILLPRSVILQLRFTLPELRAVGVKVEIYGVDGELLTDDALAELILADDEARMPA